MLDPVTDIFEQLWNCSNTQQLFQRLNTDGRNMAVHVKAMVSAAYNRTDGRPINDVFTGLTWVSTDIKDWECRKVDVLAGIFNKAIDPLVENRFVALYCLAHEGESDSPQLRDMLRQKITNCLAAVESGDHLRRQYLGTFALVSRRDRPGCVLLKVGEWVPKETIIYNVMSR